MNRLPNLIVSSVVRGSRQGDSHGGLYIVEMERETYKQVLDWDTCDIGFEGRGADRGLRGIAVLDQEVLVAASDELYLFDQDFSVVASYRNPYLKHCHEIWRFKNHVYLTSTGFDSILRFDLRERKFDVGLRFQRRDNSLRLTSFDPMSRSGPAPSVEFHLNNVHVNDFGIFVSGVKLPALLQISGGSVSVYAELPLGTHNARPFREGVLFNDTEHDRLVWLKRSGHVEIPTPRYDGSELKCNEFDESGVARQAFARGLCPIVDGLVAGGSSPTTVSVYDLSTQERLKTVNLTMDVRNAAHGLAIWPF